jgi:hypothetical protein
VVLFWNVGVLTNPKKYLLLHHIRLNTFHSHQHHRRRHSRDEHGDFIQTAA